MQCKSLWIKASAKCINVNVNVNVGVSKMFFSKFTVYWSKGTIKTFVTNDFYLKKKSNFCV